jgi:hypothetical protein
MARPGAPVPPSTQSGRKRNHAPRGGSEPRLARHSITTIPAPKSGATGEPVQPRSRLVRVGPEDCGGLPVDRMREHLLVEHVVPVEVDDHRPHPVRLRPAVEGLSDLPLGRSNRVHRPWVDQVQHGDPTARRVHRDRSPPRHARRHVGGPDHPRMAEQLDRLRVVPGMISPADDVDSAGEQHVDFLRAHSQAVRSTILGIHHHHVR